MDHLSIIVKPILTEKANSMRELKAKQYAFEVNPMANKHQVRDAVEKLFNVKTVACSIVRIRGKEKTMGMRGGKRASGFTPERKKAYVTLAENQKIEIFEGA